MTIENLGLNTAGGGDAPAGGYGDADFQRMLQAFFTPNPAFEGVLRGLAVADGGSNITIAAGHCIVNGVLISSDAVENLSKTVVAATTGLVVYAEHHLTNNTVGFGVLYNTSGNTAIPALTQNTTVWQIALAEGQQTSGSVITFSDKRRLVGQPAPVLIEEVSLAVDATTINFNDIPQYFRAIFIDLIHVRNTSLISAGVLMQFNGDTGSNYGNIDKNWGTNNFAGSSTLTTDSSGHLWGAFLNLGGFVVSTTASSDEEHHVFRLPNYASTTRYKLMEYEGTIGAFDSLFKYVGSGRWVNTNAITDIQIFKNSAKTDVMKAGTVARLYGVY